VRPGREHDITAARTDPDLIAVITTWVTDGRPGLADLGYEGEPGVFTVPHKKPKNTDLTADQQTFNAVHGALRCLGERANSLLNTTYKVLRRYRGCPWRIGTIVAAALILLHDENNRTA
jgi:DDE superfamily endonuclease